MSIDESVDIKRLEEQIYKYSPSLNRFSEVGKERIRKKLHDQLKLSQPKVALEKYHVHKLLINIEKNFQKCKDFGIIQTSNEAYEDFQKKNQLMDLKAVQLSEQSDDDDDEDNIKLGPTVEEPVILSPDQTPQSGCGDNLPLAVRKQSRKRIHERKLEEHEILSQSSFASSRKRSHRILSNESSEQLKINKNDSVDTPVTLTISLPSIIRESTDNNLEISVDFGKIDLARKVLDQRIRRISDNESTSNNSKTYSAPANNQNIPLSQVEKEAAVDDEVLSCLISEVLVEPNSVETWRATTALENINNNVGDNYNSNIAVQRRLSVGTEGNASSQLKENDSKKKQKKRTIKVKNTPILPKGPPKKRGRKPGQKNSEKKIYCEKSDLAKYVELFSNNCELPCTAKSTTLSSTMSQMVTSTTQNYEQPQQTAIETQTAQISYLINGEWTNGGICQLISSGNVGNIGLDTGHITQEDFSLNTPFEDFVNYIDSSNNDVGNNEIARVLDGNNIAPSTSSNIVDVANTVSFSRSSLVDNLRKIPNSTCIADMQKPKKNIPPPAHNFEGDILDLSLKSELFGSVIIEEEKEESPNNCEPIDLSMKTKKNENQLKGSLQLIQGDDESDDLFLRRLIDNSDFDYKDDNSIQNCDSTERNDLLFEPILDANASFKAALDMPLLGNDESTLVINQNSAEIKECDKQPNYPNAFTENFGDKNNITESSHNKVRDLNTPPHLTFIEIQDSKNLFSALKENNQISTQDQIENFEFDNIVPLQDENSKSDVNKNIYDPGTPPIMSLISTTEDFANNTQSSCNEQVLKDTAKANDENLITPNDDQNTLDANKNVNVNETKNVNQQQHLQIEEINIIPNNDKKTEDNNNNNTTAYNDAEHLINSHQLQSVANNIDTESDIGTLQNIVTMKIDVTETNDTHVTNIEDEVKDSSLKEELSSKIVESEPYNEIISLENKSDSTNLVEYDDKDSLDIQKKTEVGKDNEQSVIIDLKTRNDNDFDNESIQNAMQVNVSHCDEMDCISRVQECENLNIESVKIVEEYKKHEINNYLTPEVHLKCTSAENKNKDMQTNLEASINANINCEKTFVANIEEKIEAEFNEQRLLETTQDESIVSTNTSESDEMDIIINDSIEESSHNIGSDNTVESNDNRLLDVVLERNVKKSPIEINIYKENENRIFYNADSVHCAETQVASYNLNSSGKIVTEIEDVKSCLENEYEEKKIFTKNENEKRECKKLKPSSKLQIISVVSIDSFMHTTEDDNEFIRRTLKNHANIQNFKIFKNEDSNRTEKSIAEKSKDFVQMDASLPDASNIKTEITQSIGKFNKDEHHEDLAVVPEEIKIIFDQGIEIKSETAEGININNTLKNSKIKQNETKAFRASLEKTDLKQEPNNDIEQPSNTLDELNEETSTTDFSVSSKNNKVILMGQSTDDTKSLDISIETKAFDPIDEITDLFVQDRNSEKNIVSCDKETNKTEITQEQILECDYDDEPNCSITTQNKSLPIAMLVSEDSSTIISSTESYDSSEDLKENNSSNDKQLKLTVEEDHTKTQKNLLETVTSVEEPKEIKNIMTMVSKDTPSHNHQNRLFLSNLSLLEMEKKFDESLDFDNHFDDDVLSLATSCFNSPDDDRFGSSRILDELDDADIKTSFVKTTEDDPEFIEIAFQPQIKEEVNEIDENNVLIEPISTLTKFKIPKLGAGQLNQFTQQTNEAQPTKRIELDKITRTVQNVCAVPPLPLHPPAKCSISNTSMLAQRNHGLFPNTTGNGISGVITLDDKVDCESFAKDVLVHNNPNYVNMSRGQFAGRGGEAINSGAAVLDVAKIFGPTCLPFLVDKCPVLGNTLHNHQLREAAFVQLALEGLPKSELNTAYKFMFNHSKLFRRYFFVFCSVYSKLNNRSKLLNMVYDCEKHTGCVILLRNIFYSLIECGLNKINACRQILSRSRDKSSATIDVLVGIIFEADWGMFCDYLERFSQIPTYSFRINLLSEMAARVLRTKDTRLSSVICKCLLTLNQDDYKLVNRTPNLIALLELMKDGKVC